MKVPERKPGQTNWTQLALVILKIILVILEWLSSL